MDGQECAHAQCTCAVDLGETYCGPDCRRKAAAESPDEDVHGRCGCRHTDCMAGD